MNTMKKVLVTLANQEYVARAKQVFSSAYHHAGWDGDYLLLAVDIRPEDARWFEDKGIIVYPCQPVENGSENEFTRVCSAKYYLMKEDFKRWEAVVFVDADVIIKGSLEPLVQRQGFNACILDYTALFAQLLANDSMENENLDPRLVEKYRRIRKEYATRRLAFCTGVLAFRTDIIDKDSFAKITRLYQEYHDCTLMVDMLVYNMYFQRRWHALPRIYNVFFTHDARLAPARPDALPAVVLHFAGVDKRYKPWDPAHPYHAVWQENLAAAEGMDLKVRRAGRLVTPAQRMRCTLHWLMCSRVVLLHKVWRYARKTSVIFMNERLRPLYDFLRRKKRKGGSA